MKTSKLTARRLNGVLRKLGQRVETITGGKMNWGGCGVYASLVGKALRRLGVNARVVVTGWGSAVDLAEARSYVADVGDMREWNYNGVNFGHCGLEYAVGARVYRCDSEYVEPRRSHPALFRTYKGSLSVGEMSKLAGKRKGWNTSFDRATIPAIRAAVNEAFAPLMSAA